MERVEAYNEEQAALNPLCLSPAYRLYSHKMYTALAERFGVQKLFILSAGWGLIRADFLTPVYDLTFNKRAKDNNPAAFSPAIEGGRWLMHLPRGNTPVLFLGGRDYLPLFARLTEGLDRQRIVFRRASRDELSRPSLAEMDMEVRPFVVDARTNWHYQCAKALVTGTLEV